MSLSSYADLKTAVANWTHRSDLTSVLDDLITVGETWIYRNVKARDMEAALSITATNSVAPLPSNFIAAKIVLYVSGSVTYTIKPVAAEWIYQAYPTQDSCNPAFYAIDGTNMIFGPGAPAGATISGTYWKNLGPVSSAAHALFTSNPDLYLFAALAETAPYLKDDPRVQMWMAKRNEIASQINQYANRARSGDGMSVRVS